MYNSTSRTRSTSRHHRKQRSVTFDEVDSTFNAKKSTAKSRSPPDTELRTRRSSNQGQLDDTDDDMDGRRPPFHRHNDGKSEEALLSTSKEDMKAARRASANNSRSPSRKNSRHSEDSLGLDGHFGRSHHDGLRPTFSRSSTMRSQSPGRVEKALKETRRTYMYAGFFLALSLVSFVVQTETAVYIQHELGWSKAYAMLYLTHSSWILLYPFLLLILRLNHLKTPWKTFWRHHLATLKTISHSVEFQQVVPHSASTYNPVPYLFRTIALVTISLTIAGGSWYVAVNLTSPSDLTAIYNCSAFFAYAFSVPLLNEKLRWDKSLAVLLAIGGVLMIAYGDAPVAEKPVPVPPVGETAALGADAIATTTEGGSGTEAENRLLGNLIIGIGSVLYGLYEVLYKRLACPPSHAGHTTTAKNGMMFATLIGSLIGLFTMTVLWIPIPLLHWSGLETFELPHGKAAALLLVSVSANVVFSGSFLVLISLTSPVLSSVAALLTIFLVAFVDWLWTGKPIGNAALIGGMIIVVAFGVLSWSTWVEMREEAREKEVIDDSEENETLMGV